MNLHRNETTNTDRQASLLNPAKRSQFFTVFGLLLLGAVIFIVACNSKPAAPTSGENKPLAPQSASAVALSAEKERGMSFPDFGFMVKPADYIQNYSDQPIFRLKADFPKEKPQHVPAFV
ncbi:MAG TPA: hypothetical protein VIJ01_20405, partial [Candidatus Angelobacter sp.]